MLPTLLAALLTLALVSPVAGAPPSRFVWCVAYDTTASVPARELAEYPSIVAAWVLSRVRPGDTVILLRLDARDGAPAVDQMGGQLSRHVAAVRAIDDRIRSIKQVRDRDHGTDLGLPLDFLRRQIDTEQKLGGGPAAYRLVVVSDSIPDRAQTMSRWSATTADVRVVFVGAHANTEEAVRKLTRQAGFDDKSVQVVAFGNRSVPQRAIDTFLGRAADPTLIKKLGPRNGPVTNGGK